MEMSKQEAQGGSRWIRGFTCHQIFTSLFDPSHHTRFFQVLQETLVSTLYQRDPNSVVNDFFWSTGTWKRNRDYRKVIYKYVITAM